MFIWRVFSYILGAVIGRIIFMDILQLKNDSIIIDLIKVRLRYEYKII